MSVTYTALYVKFIFGDFFGIFLKIYLGYWPPHEKPGSCPPAKYPNDYHDDYYSRDLYGGKYPIKNSEYPNFIRKISGIRKDSDILISFGYQIFFNHILYHIINSYIKLGFSRGGR